MGGTDFNDATNPLTYWNDTAALETAKSYIPEIPWNSGCASTATSSTLNTVCAGIDPNDTSGVDLLGGGGGASNCGIQDSNFDCISGYPKPIWQTGTGVPADGVRDLPDVSLFAAVNSASNNFYIMCLADSLAQNGQACNLTGPNFSFTGVGGTSVSSPAFAGIVALVNQNEVNGTRLKAGEGQGNINYVLYKLAAAQNTTPGAAACNASAAAPNTACTFNDITVGNNSVACVGSFNVANGFGNLNNPDCSTQALNAIGVLVEPSAATQARVDGNRRIRPCDRIGIGECGESGNELAHSNEQFCRVDNDNHCARFGKYWARRERELYSQGGPEFGRDSPNR